MRSVTIGEVVAHAKPSCKSCHGTGAVALWVYLDSNNQTRKEEVCRCARKRFLKANSEKLLMEGQDWKWKEGCSPEEALAARQTTLASLAA